VERRGVHNFEFPVLIVLEALGLIKVEDAA
jgi:hypothetical protein